MHVDAIINQGAEVDIPWKDFTWNDFSLANEFFKKDKRVA
jgi:glycerol-3-phosphate dehydrogenase (NAD(P)+)